MPVFLHKQILSHINAWQQHANLKKIQLKRKIHRDIFNLGTTCRLAYPLPRSCNRAAWRWFWIWTLYNWMFHTLGGDTCRIMGLIRWLGWELMQVLWRWWFGNVDVVILDCDHSGKTRRSQILPHCHVTWDSMRYALRMYRSLDAFDSWSPVAFRKSPFLLSLLTLNLFFLLALTVYCVSFMW